MSIVNLMLVILAAFSVTAWGQVFYGVSPDPFDGDGQTSDGPEETNDLIGNGNLSPALDRLTENFGGLDNNPAVNNLFDTFSGFDFFGGNRKGMFESTTNDELPTLTDLQQILDLN